MRRRLKMDLEMNVNIRASKDFLSISKWCMCFESYQVGFWSVYFQIHFCGKSQDVETLGGVEKNTVSVDSKVVLMKEGMIVAVT